MNFLRKSFLLIFMLTLAIGCGNDSSSSGSGSSRGIAGQAFSKAQQSISKAGAELASKKIIKSLSLSMGIEAYDPHCTGLGTDDTSSADYIGCILQNNDGSPETILGAMDQVNQIIAGIESRMTLSFPASPLISSEMTFSITTADGTMTPTIQIREAAGDTAPWTQVIEVCIISLPELSYTSTIETCVSSGFSYTIQLLSNDNQLGFRTINRLMGSYEVVAFLVDSSSDELRFESWSFGNEYHTRGYVNGNVSTSLVLENVSGVRFASAFVDSGSGNWGGIYGAFDGTNICMNYESSASVDDTQAVGTCSSYPEYESGFHDFSGGSAAFATWASDSAKGLLNFDGSSFNESSIFINN